MWGQDMARAENMGMTFVEATFRGPGGSRRLRLLVDTGAAYSVLPAAVAQGLGAKPLYAAHFRLANGRRVRRTLAELEVEVLGRHAVMIVLLGARRGAMLLGCYTLEGLGLEVDPVGRTLRPQETFALFSVGPAATA